MTIRDCEIAKNNRYYNSQNIYVLSSDHVLIEGNRVYGSHRHLISFIYGKMRCQGGLDNGSLCSSDSHCRDGGVCTRIPSNGIIENFITATAIPVL